MFSRRFHFAGNTQAVPNFLWVLPYKLLHAYALAEMGKLSQSAQYCSSILTTIQGLGNKVPPGLAVCRASAADLNERLQQLAAARKVSLSGAFNAGAIVSSVGKLLDRGISALMGSERQHSRSSSFTTDIGGGGAGTLAGHSRRSSVTTVPSSPLKMPTGGAVAAASASATAGGDDAHLQPPKLLSNFMSRVASFKSIVTPEPTPGAATGTDGGEPENAFYYDNELKIWRERGKPPPAPVEEPPPPPTTASWQTPPPATLGAPPTLGNHAHAMPSPVNQQHGAAGGIGGVSRYAPAPIAVASSPPHASSSLLPQPSVSVGATFMPLHPPAASFVPGAAPTFLNTPPHLGGAAQYPASQHQTARHQAAQFMPQHYSSHSNSAARYYGQPEMEEMSEVELSMNNSASILKI
jgi:hypothetical protein